MRYLPSFKPEIRPKENLPRKHNLEFYPFGEIVSLKYDQGHQNRYKCVKLTRVYKLGHIERPHLNNVQMIKYLKSYHCNSQVFDKSQKYQLFTINRYIYIYIYIKEKKMCDLAHALIHHITTHDLAIYTKTHLKAELDEIRIYCQIQLSF